MSRCCVISVPWDWHTLDLLQGVSIGIKKRVWAATAYLRSMEIHGHDVCVEA